MVVGCLGILTRDGIQVHPDADVSAQEAEIDQLLYSLCGLTCDEMAIIEESLQERSASQEVTDTLTLDHET